MTEAATTLEDVSALGAFEARLTEAFLELMREYGDVVKGIGSSPAPAPSPLENVAGVIGFAGDLMAGTIGIQTTPEIVHAMLPETVRARLHTATCVRDWMGELANQLLGRTKNKMLRYGVTFQMSPPTAVTGTLLNIMPSSSDTAQWSCVETDAGQIHLLYDVRTDGELVLQESQDSETVAPEGDLVLF